MRGDRSGRARGFAVAARAPAGRLMNRVDATRGSRSAGMPLQVAHGAEPRLAPTSGIIDSVTTRPGHQIPPKTPANHHRWMFSWWLDVVNVRVNNLVGNILAANIPAAIKSRHPPAAVSAAAPGPIGIATRSPHTTAVGRDQPATATGISPAPTVCLSRPARPRIRGRRDAVPMQTMFCAPRRKVVGFRAHSFHGDRTLRVRKRCGRSAAAIAHTG